MSSYLFFFCFPGDLAAAIYYLLGPCLFDLPLYYRLQYRGCFCWHPRDSLVCVCVAGWWTCVDGSRSRHPPLAITRQFEAAKSDYVAHLVTVISQLPLFRFRTKTQMNQRLAWRGSSSARLPDCASGDFYHRRSSGGLIPGHAAGVLLPCWSAPRPITECFSTRLHSARLASSLSSTADS